MRARHTAALSAACGAWAQALPVHAAELSPAPEFSSSLWQMFGGLALVLGLMLASLWLLRQLSRPRGAAAGMLRVVAAAAVGPRERVVVVELHDTWLVLGVAPGAVRLLTQTTRVGQAAAVAASAAAATAAVQAVPPAAAEEPFAARLKQALDALRAKPSTAPPGAPPAA